MNDYDNNMLYAYLDESGNSDLEVQKEGATNLYICAAVLVNTEQQVTVRTAMQNLSKKQFSGGMIKSSAIGGNIDRRLRVLSYLSDMDFYYYALVVDKTRLNSESGLQFKQSFYKCLHQMIYRTLRRSGAQLNVIADKHGSKSFMDSIPAYLESKGQLLFGFEHEFKNSADEPLIQLADLIAGSLQYVCDPDKKRSRSTEIAEILKPKQAGIDGWPLHYYVTTGVVFEGEGELDKYIRESCIKSVGIFEKQFGDSDDEDRQMQVAILNHLLFIKELNSTDDDAVYAQGLIDHLERLSYPKLTIQGLTSRVIGPLRDEGMVIAGNNDGYRLAMSIKNIDLYLKHDRAIIEPMLRRLKIARETIRMATANRFDILSTPEYAGLKCLVDSFESQRLDDIGKHKNLGFQEANL